MCRINVWNFCIHVVTEEHLCKGKVCWTKTPGNIHNYGTCNVVPWHLQVLYISKLHSPCTVTTCEDSLCACQCSSYFFPLFFSFASVLCTCAGFEHIESSVGRWWWSTGAVGNNQSCSFQNISNDEGVQFGLFL